MASSNAPTNGVFGKLAGVSIMELPYAAAQIVKKAPAAERSAVAQEVVRAALSLSKPGMTPFVVSSICQAAPEVAIDVVNIAVSLQPDQLLSIGKAALSAAPDKVEAIVATLCKSENRAFAEVAVMADAQLPNAADHIIAGVASAVPELAQSLGQARVYSASQPMSAVMQKTRELASASVQRHGNEVALSDNGPAASKLRESTGLGAVELAKIGSSSASVEGTVQSRVMTVASLGPNVFQPGTSLFDPPPPQAPPTLGPPFTPFSGSSTEYKAGDGTVLPPGSPRSYSGP